MGLRGVKNNAVVALPPKVIRNSYAVFLVDRQGRIASWSPDVRKVFGYPKLEFVDRPFGSLFSPEDVSDGLPERLLERARKSDWAEQEHKARHRNGNFHFVSSLIVGLRQNGRLQKYLVAVRDVTERKIGEEAIRQTSEQRRPALQFTITGTYLYHSASGLLELDDCCRPLLGITATGPLSNEEALAAIHPADRDRVARAIEKAHDPDGLGRFEEEYRVVHPDGSVRWILDKGQVTFRSGRIPVRACGTLIDVTQRKQAEEALCESRRQLEEAQATAHLGDWEWDIANDLVRWSAELYRNSGLTPQTFTPSFEGFLRTIHPKDRARVRRTVEQALRSGEPFAYEARMLREDGSVRYKVGRGRVIRDDSGNSQKMMGTAQDVTELKFAERKFRELLEAAPDAMVIVDARGRIALVNPQAEILFGYSRVELVGRSVEMLLADARRKAWRERWAAFLAAPTRPMAENFELHARRKGGGKLPVEISVSPLVTEEGILVIAAVRDVTERKLAEERLREEEKLRTLADGLVRGQEEERRRLAQALHEDVNQRLAGVSIELGMFRQRFPQMPAAEAQRQIEALEEIVRTLSDDIRRTAHQLLPASLELLGLGRALESHCNDFSRLHGVPVRLQVRKLPDFVDPDIALCLFRVAQEALHNVARHAGASAVRVQVAAFRGGLKLSVQDNGVGLKENGSNGNGNAGMGLIGMEDRVRRLSGTLTLRSRPGEGTVVEAWVPLSQQAVPVPVRQK